MIWPPVMDVDRAMMTIAMIPCVSPAEAATHGPVDPSSDLVVA